MMLRLHLTVHWARLRLQRACKLMSRRRTVSQLLPRLGRPLTYHPQTVVIQEMSLQVREPDNVIPVIV